MKATGAPDSPSERLAEEALAIAFAGRRVRYGVACLGAASPSYHGVESATYLVADSPGAEPAALLKVSEPAAAALLDPAAAFKVAHRIAGLGLGPEPLHLMPDQGAILFRRLGPEWRPATLDLLRRPDRMGAVLAAFGRIAAGEAFGIPWTVFDGIRRMRTLLGEDAETLPPDAWFLFEWGEAIAAALGAAGMGRRPVHGDPHASNLLFAPDGALMFVDFDMGCDTDPHYQLAAFLNEACQFEGEMRLGIEMAEGTCRAEVFSRCRAYGAADDLYWGLRALVMDKVSPRRSLEFRKYASWRLLRCRMRVTRPDFEETLRTL